MATTGPHRIRVALLALAIALALYAALGFFLVPRLVRGRIQTDGSAALQRTVTVERVQFNPFTFVTKLEGLRVAGRAADAPLVTLERGRFNFDAFESLVRWRWQFGEVVLTAPHVRLAVAEDGAVNIADLLGGPRREGPKEGGPKLGMDVLSVEAGSLAFEDRSRGAAFATTIQPIVFTLEDFSTEPGRGGAYRLTGRTEAGETLTWQGRVAVAPFSSTGRIEFAALDLRSYQPLVARWLGGEIRSGRLDVAANYEVAFGGQRAVQLRDVTLRGTDAAVGWAEASEPAIAFAGLTVTAPEVDLLARRAQVSEVTVDGLAARVVRDRDGGIDLQRLWRQPQPAAAEPAAATTATTNPAMQVQVDRIALRDGRVRFTDQATPAPAELAADQIALTLTHVSTDPAAESGVELALRWLDGPGKLEAKGTARRAPLRMDLQVHGTQLALAALTPYLQTFAHAEIAAGASELDGRLELSQNDGAPLALTWTGQAAVDALAVRDPASGEELLRWSHLGVTEGEVGTSPNRFSAREIKLVAPELRILREEDGSTNLAAVLGGAGSRGQSAPAPDQRAEAAPAAAGADRAAADSAASPAIAIGAFTIQDGALTFVDSSTDPSTEADITAIGGSLQGLSTERGEAGRLELTAQVLGSATAKVEGTVNVVGADAISGSNVALDMTSVELDPFEPYVVRFLGHRVEQGEMRGDFAYRVSGGALDGKNHVVLDNFFLGEPVESPDALHVPVKLALAVLRNRDGQIVLDVPVGGSLKSPDFDFAQVIRGAFGDILGRVATAPFALLGSMFGAPEAKLDEVEFPPAQAEFTPDAQGKLDVLARALQERPTLKLVIHWQPAPAADRAALAQRRLDELLQQQREQLAGGRGGELTEQQVLRALYATRVMGVEAGRLSEGGAPPSDAAAPPEQAAWYARFWHWFWGPWPEHAASPPGAAEPAPAEPGLPQLSDAQLREELLQTIKLEPEAFAAVARDRANAVRDRLIKTGLSPERVEVAAAAPSPGEGSAERPRVSFTLEEMSTSAVDRPESAGQPESSE